MPLEDYQNDMEMCCRCSHCKFIPLEKVGGLPNATICPSIARYNFHAYSGGGRMAIGIAMLEGRLDYTGRLLDVVYNCLMCGGCDISCKYAMDMEVLEPINETRITCVAEGHTLPILDEAMDRLRREDTMVPGVKSKRGEWAQNLTVKDFTREKVEVIFHAGCRTVYSNTMWKVAKTMVQLLQNAGIDIGINRDNESCCGSRAYQTGYKEDFLNQARENAETFNRSGARILLTGCADCYYAFKVLHDKFSVNIDQEILHVTEYLDRLIGTGTLKPTRHLNMKVTYHDPCHLGRLGESYIHWNGKPVPGQIRVFDPPKEFRRGTHGVYQPPRNVVKSIPGVTLVEMGRIKEYAWCCGAGGGVKETNPDFARWTALKRLNEAEATGAEAIVTACPGCQQSLADAAKEKGSPFKVYDVAELLKQAVSEGGH